RPPRVKSAANPFRLRNPFRRKGPHDRFQTETYSLKSWVKNKKTTGRPGQTMSTHHPSFPAEILPPPTCRSHPGDGSCETAFSFGFNQPVPSVPPPVHHIDPVGIRIGEDEETMSQHVHLQDRFLDVHGFQAEPLDPHHFRTVVLTFLCSSVFDPCILPLRTETSFLAEFAVDLRFVFADLTLQLL